MTYRDMLINAIDIQSEVRFYYYDYEKEERIQITEDEAKDHEIKWLYAENHVLCIEIGNPNE